MTLFKLFHGAPEVVEKALNEWSAGLPAGAKVRRTQLAASGPAPAEPGLFVVGPARVVYALVSYEVPAP